MTTLVNFSFLHFNIISGMIKNFRNRFKHDLFTVYLIPIEYTTLQREIQTRYILFISLF